MLFGNVGEIEEVREGPGHRQCGVQREVGEIIGEMSESVLIAVASGLGHGADALDDLIDRFAFEFAKRVAEQLAEQPDVIAKRFMRIGHGTHSTIAPSMPTDGCLPDANSQSRGRDVVRDCRRCFARVPARVAGIFFDHHIFMEKLLQDLRFSLRSLVRQPAFALTVILTLALGIGATTAIFSVVNALLLKPLPFEESERIVSIQNLSARTGLPFPNVSAPGFPRLGSPESELRGHGLLHRRRVERHGQQPR